MKTLIVFTIFFTFFACQSIAGRRKRREKDYLDSGWLRSADTKKLKSFESEFEADSKETSLLLFNKIEDFHTPCSGISEIFYFEETTDEIKNSYLYECDDKFDRWWRKKQIKFYHQENSVKILINAIDNYLKEDPDNLTILQDPAEDVRLTLYDRIRRAWRVEGEYDIVRLVYNFGEGVCQHLTMPPFNNIRPFYDTILNLLNELKFVTEIKKKKIPMGLILYTLQIICEKLYEDPTNYMKLLEPKLKERSKLELEGAIAMQISQLRAWAEEKICTWQIALRIKQVHRIKDLLVKIGSSIWVRKLSEQTNFYLETCLDQFSSAHPSGSVESLYNIDESERARWRKLTTHIGDTLHNFDLPESLSVNEILDVRFEGSAFRKQFINGVKLQISSTGDLALAKLYIDILIPNRFDWFKESVFLDTGFEFLTNLLSIKGYNPEKKHLYLDFYCTYRLIENAYIVPVE